MQQQIQNQNQVNSSHLNKLNLTLFILISFLMHSTRHTQLTRRLATSHRTPPHTKSHPTRRHHTNQWTRTPQTTTNHTQPTTITNNTTLANTRRLTKVQLSTRRNTNSTAKS